MDVKLIAPSGEFLIELPRKHETSQAVANIEPALGKCLMFAG